MAEVYCFLMVLPYSKETEKML